MLFLALILVAHPITNIFNATKSRTTLSDVIFSSDCMVLTNNMPCTHLPPNGLSGSILAHLRV